MFDTGTETVRLVLLRESVDESVQDERVLLDRAVEHAFTVMLEEQARRAHAEDRVVSRDEFLAIVSHDLRSPLDVIGINAALLAQHAPGDETGAKFKKWARKHRAGRGGDGPPPFGSPRRGAVRRR